MRFYLEILCVVALTAACGPGQGAASSTNEAEAYADAVGSPTELVFAYGTLKPGHRNAQPFLRCWPGAVVGEMHTIKNATYPGAIKFGTASASFSGFVLEVPRSQLTTLDRIEGTSSGLYVRERTVTQDGRSVWVYRYNGYGLVADVTLSAWEPEKDRPDLCE